MPITGDGGGWCGGGDFLAAGRTVGFVPGVWGLAWGLVCGFVCGLVWGLVWGFLWGLACGFDLRSTARREAAVSGRAH